MKDLSKLLLAGLFTIGFSACSDDGIGSENGPNDGPDAVYMQFKLEMPESRSVTNTGDDDDYVSSNDGTEVGTNSENQVSNVLVLLTAITNETETIIATSEASFPAGEKPDGEGIGQADEDTYVVSFRADKLTSYVGNEIRAYVFCNPTSNLKTAITGENGLNSGYELTEDETDDDIWNNGFLMSNANNTDYLGLKLPDTEEALMLHNSPSNPKHLGTIRVERSVARFDYKDGSKSGKASTYPIMVDKDDKNKTLANIVLEDVALINLSKEFFYLRRIAEQKGTGNTDAVETQTELLGKETNVNYIVDTDWMMKRGFDPTKSNDYAQNFHHALSDASSWVWVPISNILEEDNKADPNNWTGNTTTTDKNGYHIWRYVTENTIPTIADQENGISTGLVFRGKIELTDNNWSTTETYDKAMTDAFTKLNEPVYVYQNKLVGTKSMIKSLVWDDTNKKFKEDDSNTFIAALSIAAQGAFFEIGTENGKAVAADRAEPVTPGLFGFTTYFPEDTDGDGNKNGYYAYYYYWNRHNDNGNNGKMGVMEFAVVRNNVYKLSVTGINKFGHATPTPPSGEDPEDIDPDPVDPTDPDEDENVYFQVAVQVLPWTVRVNNIIF